MENWTNEIWLAIGAAFIIGMIVSCAVLRMTKGNIQKQLKLENELKVANAKIDEQKQQLEQHFAKSATLLATLAEDYKKLYSHLAEGSAKLIPETQIAEFKQPQLEQAKEAVDENQPKDYSEGSSGLLKSSS